MPVGHPREATIAPPCRDVQRSCGIPANRHVALAVRAAKSRSRGVPVVSRLIERASSASPHSPARTFSDVWPRSAMRRRGEGPDHPLGGVGRRRWGVHVSGVALVGPRPIDRSSQLMRYTGRTRCRTHLCQRPSTTASAHRASSYAPSSLGCSGGRVAHSDELAGGGSASSGGSPDSVSSS